MADERPPGYDEGGSLESDEVPFDRGQPTTPTSRRVPVTHIPPRHDNTTGGWRDRQELAASMRLVFRDDRRRRGA
jgi:hypothetical protein